MMRDRTSVLVIAITYSYSELPGNLNYTLLIVTTEPLRSKEVVDRAKPKVVQNKIPDQKRSMGYTFLFVFLAKVLLLQ